MAGRLFCFGLGYTGSALARALRGDGWRIAGTCREPDKAALLAQQDFAVDVFDRRRPLADAAAALAGTTHMLVAVPPDEDGDPVLAAHAADIAAIPGLAWVGYLSTTAVYGDRGGAWVDETAERRATGPRGQRRIAAEDGWLRLGRDRGVPLHVFRLAGIYGPGRNALEAVRRGEARRIVKPGQVFSRIHVDDILTVLRASMARPNPGAVYNVCDDEPAPADEVVAFAAALLGCAPPPTLDWREAALSPMARSFYVDNKRVSNRRIKDELGVRLAFPDYRSGLRALASSSSS